MEESGDREIGRSGDRKASEPESLPGTTFRFEGTLYYNGKIDQQDLERLIEGALCRQSLVHDVKARVGKTAPPAPLHPFEVRISIGGDDWDYVLRTVDELALHLKANGPDDSGTISGGGGGCHSLDVQRRNISVEQYRRELDEWFNAMPRPASSPSVPAESAQHSAASSEPAEGN